MNDLHHFINGTSVERAAILGKGTGRVRQRDGGTCTREVGTTSSVNGPPGLRPHFYFSEPLRSPKFSANDASEDADALRYVVAAYVYAADWGEARTMVERVPGCAHRRRSRRLEE
jgi:hypothetical protein